MWNVISIDTEKIKYRNEMPSQSAQAVRKSINIFILPTAMALPVSH